MCIKHYGHKVFSGNKITGEGMSPLFEFLERSGEPSLRPRAFQRITVCLDLYPHRESLCSFRINTRTVFQRLVSTKYKFVRASVLDL